MALTTDSITADPSPKVQAAGKGSTPSNTTAKSGCNITPAVRRFHKKSRTGCSKCKARKIKCDERHPACLNCISHGVKCPYLEKPNRGISNTKRPNSEPNYSPMEVDSVSEPLSSCKTSTPTATEPSSKPQLCIADDNIPTELSHKFPTVELELLHHFTVHTYSTLTHESTVQEFWRTTAIQVGLKCSYMMQALLAVSALHLADQTPDKRDLYIARGMKLHRQASRSAVRFMNREDINTDEAVNLFLFSSLTMFFALACPRDHSLSSFSPSPTTNNVFPEWTFLLNGTKSLTNILGPQATHHPVLQSFLASGLKRWSSSREMILAACFPDRMGATGPSTNTREELAKLSRNRKIDYRLDSLEQTSLEGLRRRVTDSISLADVQPSSDPTKRTTFTVDTPNSPSSRTARLLQVYTHALDELELSFAYTTSFPLDPQDVTLWLWEVSDSLVPLLKHQPPAQEAVAIFAHFAILLNLYQDKGQVWWVQGWAKHIVRQAHDVLDEVHKPWIVWPMREVGLDFDFAGGGIRNTMFSSLV